MPEFAGRTAGLSKSKLISWLLQRPKRLWLETHKPRAVATSAATQAPFGVGQSVGSVAQPLNPGGVVVVTLARFLEGANTAKLALRSSNSLSLGY